MIYAVESKLNFVAKYRSNQFSCTTLNPYTIIKVSHVLVSIMMPIRLNE
jgi:hypothetical protein